MKKLPLFVAFFAMLFSAVSCKDDDKVVGAIEFAPPQVTDITPSSAWVRCQIEGDVDVAKLGQIGFVYGPADGDASDYDRLPCTVDGAQIGCRLSGLRPATGYRGWFSLDMGGNGLLKSQEVSFTTADITDETPMIEVSGKTTIKADAEGGDYSIDYEIRNPSSTGELQVELEGLTWAHSFDVSVEGVVAFKVDANTADERTGQFDLIYPGAQPVTITVSQVGENTPVIEITGKKTIVAAAEGGDYSTTYEIRNPVSGASVRIAEGETTWIHSFDVSEPGVIAFQVDQNGGGERTALFEVTYPDAQPVTLTVTQEEGTPGPTPDKVVTLTRNMDWPNSYQAGTFRLGDYEYYLTNAAIYDENNGIQFKSETGFIANKEDMGVIGKVELVYGPGDSRKNFVLYVGDSETPESTMIEAETINGVYTYDCSGHSFHYFKLENGSGAGYLYEIKIYIGEGGKPDPDKNPVFENLTSSNITKEGATLSCDFSYGGDKTVSEAGFRYAKAGGAEQTTATTTTTGTKSAAINSLTPSTTYSYYFYAVVGGDLFKSGTASFTTDDEGGKPHPSDTYRSGWAELPTQVEKSGDYYYAYHLRADNKNMRNYSVCYSKELGCPVWVSAPMHNCYKGSSGRTDSYAQDPDLGCSQVGRRSGYTRGHMLGSSDRTISRETNRQVFYYSNIGPQLQAGFNTGGGAWNNLESFVDGQWCADTLYQVIGCYWENKNKKVDGTVIPTHYYKVLLRTKKGNSGKWVVDCSSSELKCAAFILEHKNQQGLKPSRSMMISVSELEKMTGFTFFANVPNAPKSEFNASDWGL